jgi:multimeric flavodoxin WrbA
MNVLAINASPHKNKGNTALILSPFLEGMSAAGADRELIYTSDLQIHPCNGDLSCLFRPDGRCIHRDDMDRIIPKIRDADILVFATPLFTDGFAGPMKVFMDRMIPLFQIFVEKFRGHIRHPLKEQKNRRIVLVSSCGFWELDNFDPIVTHMRAITRNLNGDFAGALLRPHASSLKGMLATGAPVQDIPEAARLAGELLVRDGSIPSSLLETISRPLLPQDDYIEMNNQRFRELIESRRNRTPGQAPMSGESV